MIVLENVSKRFKTGVVLDSVSLTVSAGEILAVTGASGAGKTTLLRLIAGFIKPERGRIAIDDHVVAEGQHMVAPHKRNVSYIFQDFGLWPHMRVEEHIQFVLEAEQVAKKEAKSRLIDVLQAVRLADCGKRYPSELSGGEKQRLAIARAIAGKKSYLLMDEPFCHLDSVLKRELEALVLELKDKMQMGIVYVTHQVYNVNNVASRIVILSNGSIEGQDLRQI